MINFYISDDIYGIKKCHKMKKNEKTLNTRDENEKLNKNTIIDFKITPKNKKQNKKT